MFGRNKVENVPAQDWEQWVNDNNGLLLDVREAREWALGTLPGAELMAMSEIGDKWQNLDPAKATLVVCRSGNRSMTVAKALQNAGFANVANMSGGMKALGMQG